MNHLRVYTPAVDYGSGSAWRRIRLTRSVNAVLVEMEDVAHGMVCRVEHDGQRITALHPEFRRIPMNTCSGASEPLQSLVGMSLDVDHTTFFAGGRARQNCTHMFDLVWLATAHAKRDETVRDYVMELPDDRGGEVRPSTLRRNGELVLQWQLRDSTVHEPEPFAGRNLFRGFTSWAMGHFRGDELEAILVLQKGCFVAQSRRVELPGGPLTAVEQERNAGLCHGFGHERIGVAQRLDGSRRDFTDHPERLLQFR